jgi:hypothetical protein
MGINRKEVLGRSPSARGRAGRFTVLVSAAVVLVCVALAAPVLAYASRATHGVVVRKLAKGSATATCPRGEHVGFGGVVAQFHAPFGAGAVVLPEGMRRTAANKWTVYGQSATGLVGSRLTSEAYCETGAVPTAVTKTVRLPALDAASAIATCPAGTVVVGGGYNSGASIQHQEVVIAMEALSPTQWVVAMGNISRSASTVTAIAYCAKGVTPTQVVATVKVAGNKGGTARVNCPSGTSIVFGGVLASFGGAGNKITALVPFSWTAASNRQWVVTAFNLGNTAGNLDAFAYCR